MPKIPYVMSDIPRDLRQYTDRVREALNELEKKSSGSGAAVTVEELVSAGIAGYAPGGGLQPGRNFPPLGAYNYPTAPTGLEADGALANVILNWDKPPYIGHAHTEVWAAPPAAGGGPPALGDAVLIGQSPGDVFTHNIGGGATRWYWVRFVNIAGETGPFNSVAGTKGETGKDPEYLIGLLEGQITETQLFKSLGERIDLIDGGSDLPGSVAARVEEIRALPAWDPDTGYTTGNKATYEGAFYLALQPSTNYPPADFPLYWEKLGEYETLTEALEASVDDIRSVSATLEVDYYTIAESDLAISNATTTLKSEIEDPNGTSVGASLQTEAQTRADETGDLFAQYTVKVDLNGYVSGYGLASSVVNGTPTSDFIVRADSFSIGRPGGTTPAPQLPFVVRTSSTTINGESVPAGVYMRDAFIQNGTITRAKIGDAAIDNAKIAELDAGKITTGFLGAGRIDTASIAADTAFLSNLTVDTLNLAGNAVIVPEFSEWGSFVQASAIGAFRKCGELTITLNVTAPIVILWSLEQGFTAGQKQWAFYLERSAPGSSVIQERGYSTTDPMFFGDDWPVGLAYDGPLGAGTYTYEIYHAGEDTTVSAKGRLLAIGVKR